MRFISTKIHAAMDYFGGALLIIGSLLWVSSSAEAEVSVAGYTLVVVGSLMLLQSLITDYELSLSNLIPMPAHLSVDALAGVALVASPWLLGFSDVVWIPHVVIGLLMIGGALTTQLHREVSSVDPAGRSPNVSA